MDTSYFYARNWDLNDSMQCSGGALLDPGLTGSTP